MYIQTPPPELEISRLDAIEKFSQYLSAEVLLAQHGDGYFEKKYWDDYLIIKYECQAAANKFYVLLHELAK